MASPYQNLPRLPHGGVSRRFARLLRKRATGIPIPGILRTGRSHFEIASQRRISPREPNNDLEWTPPGWDRLQTGTELAFTLPKILGVKNAPSRPWIRRVAGQGWSMDNSREWQAVMVSLLQFSRSSSLQCSRKSSNRAHWPHVDPRSQIRPIRRGHWRQRFRRWPRSR